MATFITVSEGDAQLLRRNQEEVHGNRLRKLESDEQVATDRAIKATVAQQQIQLEPGGRRKLRFRREEPAASQVPRDYNLVVVELFWRNGADYDINIGRNNEFVGWYFSSRSDTSVNDGTLWNQLFWLGDIVDDGPASEFAVFDRSRSPTPGSNYPAGNFAVELFSYCYAELSTLPLTVSIYPVNVTPATAFNPNIGLSDVERLKALGLNRALSFDVTNIPYIPGGDKGIKIGEIRFPGAKLLSVTS